MESVRKSPNRLSIEIDEESHKEIKIFAAMRNITIRKWVSRALKAALDNEKKYNLTEK